MKNTVLLTWLVSTIALTSTHLSIADDDFLLSVIPSIISATNATCDASRIGKCDNKVDCEASSGYWYSGKCNIEPLSLVNIRKLIGKWSFVHTTYIAGPPMSRTVNYEFFGNTIERYDAVSHSITGVATSSDFNTVLTHKIAALFDSEVNLYSAQSFAPNSYGDLYIFRSLRINTPSIDCHYLTNSNLEINPSYAIVGGTQPCEKLDILNQNN